MEGNDKKPKMSKQEVIDKIAKILDRKKYRSSLAGDYPYQTEEYAEMIYREMEKRFEDFWERKINITTKSKPLYDNSDYWVVRGNTIDDAIKKVSEYSKKDLIRLIINNRLNDFVSNYADYEDNEEPVKKNLPNGKPKGKRIPYIGWFWRATDFVRGEITIGNCGEFIGVMENNKWGYPSRLLTKDEARKVTDIVWQAKLFSEEGGLVGDIEKNTKKKLEELWGLFQTFKI